MEIKRVRPHAYDKMRVYRRDGSICTYCKKKIGFWKHETDHVFPVAKGGTCELENLVVSCKECNRKKRDKVLSKEAERKIQMDIRNKYVSIQEALRTLRENGFNKSISWLRFEMGKKNIASDKIFSARLILKTSLDDFISNLKNQK